jgi:carbamoyltransferase
VIVLGLNGWTEATHDPAAALLIDGRIVAFVEEERLNRVRHAPFLAPVLAAEYVLRAAGVTIEDVDAIAYGWDLPSYYRGRGGEWTMSDADFVQFLTGMRPKRCPPLYWVRHHDAHAASTYFWSGAESAAVLVADGRGEDNSISVYRAEGTDLKLVRTWPIADSLGVFYHAASVHCGFGRFDAGKTMGLASYGKTAGALPITWDADGFTSVIPARARSHQVHQEWLSYFETHHGDAARVPRRYDTLRARMTAEDISPDRLNPDAAALAQATVEQAMLALGQYALRETGADSLCVSGGVALNCVANGLLTASGLDVHLQPVSDDSGVALGAAFLVAAGLGEPVTHDGRVGLGPGYDSADIAAYLRTIGLSATEVTDPSAAAARRLLDGAVIGWFQGGAELGPRALGHRSILTLPTPGTKHSRVNSVKRREQWRPFAPSLLESETPFVFGRALRSPYMLESFTLTDAATEAFPAVSHVDGTARPQTVSDEAGPFGRLLSRLRADNGHGIVLNTSFNGPGEPIVCTPEDAVRAFHSMSLDSLVIENFVLDKQS